MMSATVDLTESIAHSVTRSLLLQILPDGIEVVRGQDNRVPEPLADDYVVITSITRTRLATNWDTYDNVESKFIRQGTQLGIQLDIHGPNSPQNSQIISTLLRDEYAVDFYSASGYDIAPLYADDPRQIPFTNGEDQVEDRWVVDLQLQLNAVVTVPQDFADQLSVQQLNKEPS
jgi:hypothetical protein